MDIKHPVDWLSWSEKKCKFCGCESFVAHLVTYMDVLVYGNGIFIDNLSSCFSANAHLIMLLKGRFFALNGILSPIVITELD